MELEPPDGLSEDERLVWKDGLLTGLALMQDVADQYAEGIESDLDDEPEEICSDCGQKKVKALGGFQCINCDT